MFSHVTLGSSDFNRSMRFYEPLMAVLGQELKFSAPDVPLAAWMTPGVPRPLFVICSPLDERAATVGNGQMTAFLGTSQENVREAYNLALSLGGQCEGPPGPRPHYHANYYGAYFRDPDGNKLCVCHHDGA